ncbi:MAG: hypothetical protein QFE16_09990 [Pseudomonadota bacterium]|nr:hypothetical protein [Pseudomonadota bacterium]
MSTAKSFLCLLVIVVAYGIAGHLDYEDAVTLEEIERQSVVVVADDCAQVDTNEASMRRPSGRWSPDQPLPRDATRSGGPAFVPPCPTNQR